METKLNIKEEQTLDILMNEENISDEILQQLESDEELLHTLRDAQMLRSAIMDKDINVESKLKEFHTKHETSRYSRNKRKSWLIYTYTTVATIAAVMLIVFLMHSPEKPYNEKGSLLVFEAKEQPVESVTLQTKSGKSINIKDKTKNIIKPIAIPKEVSSSKDNEIMILAVPYGESFDITLPDGTIAYMHPGSQLIFPSSFNNSERIVELQGEAYFQVVKDTNHPFIVKTGTLETIVLGTEFDVTAYDDRPINVTLVNGSVNVVTNNHKLKLAPGEQATVDENTSINAKNVDVSQYTMWRDGYLFYDNMTLEDIMRSIGKIYNHSVVFYNKEQLHIRMRFIAERNKGIENILNTLNSINRIHASISDGVIIIK